MASTKTSGYLYGRWCYSISNNLQRQKHGNANVTILTKFFWICFPIKYKFSYKNGNIKKAFVWLFLIFRFSFSFFNVLLLPLAESTIKQFLVDLQVDGRFFVSFLTRALCHAWKISRISNSKSPTWSLVNFHSQFFLADIS